MSTARARDEIKTTVVTTRNTRSLLGGINRIFCYLPFHTFLIQIGNQLANSRPKRLKTQESAGKVLANGFFLSLCGIVFVDYLEKGKPVNSEQFTALLNRFENEIKKKRPHIEGEAKKKELFYENYAPCYISRRLR